MDDIRWLPDVIIPVVLAIVGATIVVVPLLNEIRKEKRARAARSIGLLERLHLATNVWSGTFRGHPAPPGLETIFAPYAAALREYLDGEALHLDALAATASDPAQFSKHLRLLIIQIEIRSLHELGWAQSLFMMGACSYLKLLLGETADSEYIGPLQTVLAAEGEAIQEECYVLRGVIEYGPPWIRDLVDSSELPETHPDTSAA